MKLTKLCDNELIKLNLQLFTDGDGGDGTGTDGGNPDGDGSGGGEDNPISFASQSEFDSVVDKRITKAIETAQSKWQTESEKRIAEAKSEGEKLAKMNEEQRSALEKQQQDEALAQREADITRRELRAQSLEQLAEKELPKELIDVVVLTDAEACNKSIEGIEKAFRSAVETAVNKRLAASAENPAGSGNSSDKESKGSQYAKQANSRSEVKTDLWNKN
ncbi:MAG: DUF4355 domain-containing protein [Streptococcaceae bacterium]|nr:DUF4355 domain-containing protein [Streptococcaceae bacterium]